MVLLTAIVLASTMPARFLRIDGINALNIRGHVYSLGADFPFHIGKDTVQTTLDGTKQALELVRSGKKIGSVDLTESAEKWLQDDSVWGGHENANQVRYLTERYGGILHADLTECLPYSDGSALGVLTLRSVTDWHKLASAQVLIRISRNPFKIASFRFLKRVPTPQTPAPISDVPRLYRFGRDTFLIDGSNLAIIDSMGNPTRTVCAIPDGAAPIGMSADRWIDFQQFDAKGNQSWLALDLKDAGFRAILTIPSKPHPYDTENIECGVVDPHSQFLLFERRIFRPDHTEFFTVSVKNGAQTLLEKPAFRVLGDFAVDQEVGKVLLYSAKSGKFVQEVSIPQG